MRVALAGPLLALAVARGPGGAVAAVLVIGFLSDVYDGVIARRFDAVTPDLRRLDSTADTIFYLAVAICLWRLDRAAVASNAWMIGGTCAVAASRCAKISGRLISAAAPLAGQPAAQFATRARHA